MERFAVASVLFFFWLACPVWGDAQAYTSYFTGNATDTVTEPFGGVCMMGGAAEDDNAMAWFLGRANGGDVLVLRTSGSNGYNDYLYSGLGVAVNSVETIVFNDPSADGDAYIHRKIGQAEAIWFAGGDQWTYVSYWRHTPIDSLINLAVAQRHVAIGGTSAGMAILGGYYFSAQNGTVTSSSALATPYRANVTVDSTAFLKTPFLADVITDTHYDNPNRKGRHVVFMARILTDYGKLAKGIACDENTAVCIGSDGIARVFGGYPAYDDNAYFIQPNCGIANMAPEICTMGSPLTWYLDGRALKAYRAKGTAAGTNTFDLNDWRTGEGGMWLHWSVDRGMFAMQEGSPIDCSPPVDDDSTTVLPVIVYPNPVVDVVRIAGTDIDVMARQVEVISATGRICRLPAGTTGDGTMDVNVVRLARGFYCLRVKLKDGAVYNAKIIKN
ncbi:MAG: Type 1 glutamine amidotransferase-like domain-containing protein [Breznakibacter sp.]